MISFALAVVVIEAAVLVSGSGIYQVGNRHGGGGGSENTFECPQNGALTGVNYRAGSRVDSLEFICTSSIGITKFGPYGGTGGSYGELRCPQGQIISSFYGRSAGKLDQVGIRCKPVNEIYSGTEGTKIRTFGGGGGSAFDDLAASRWARPVVVKVRSGWEMDSLQVTYQDTPIPKLCTDCSAYKEEWAPKHGGDGGSTYQFACPEQGVITGITYRSATRLDSIQFNCTSSLGVTVFGPYGGTGGKGPFEERCPPGQYISSIHGRSAGKVDALGIRCSKVGQTGGSPKFDAHGGGGGSPFDDESYSRAGMRPVLVKVSSGWEVDSIQMKYGNMPVVFNCRVTDIEVLDKNIKADFDGTEVIGITSGSSCSSNIQQLKLDYADTVQETVSVETTEGGEINWGTTVSVTYTTGFEMAGLKTEMSIGLSQSVGGSKSWSSSRSTSTTTASQKAQGTVVSYQAPGACLVVGFLNRYKIQKDKIPVKYHFTCDAGTLEPQSGTIKLTSKTYSKADFQDHQFAFTSVNECTQKARSCVAMVEGRSYISDPTTLGDEFKKCFVPGSGTYY